MPNFIITCQKVINISFSSEKIINVHLISHHPRVMMQTMFADIKYMIKFEVHPLRDIS